MKRTRKKWTLAGITGLLLCTLALIFYGNLGFADQQLNPDLHPAAATPIVTRGVVNELEEVSKNISKQLGTVENPFVILEIVPYEGYAEFGYLISGCEPVDLERLSYYQDMTTVSQGIGQITLGEWKQRYYFAEEAEYKAAYTEKTKSGSNSLKFGVDGDNDIVEEIYDKDVYGYYEVVSDGYGCFKQVTSGEEAALTYTMQWVGEGKGNIVWHTLNDDTTRQDTMRALTILGDRLYTSRNSLTTKNVTGEDGKAGSKLYSFYKYDYKNENVFLKNSLKVADSNLESYSVVVKTITPSELNTDLDWIAKADLISIAPKSHVEDIEDIWGALNRFNKAAVSSPATDFVKNDLSWEAVMTIHEKVLASDNYAALVMDARCYLMNNISGTDSLNSAVKKDSVSYYQTNWDGNVVSSYSFSNTGCTNNVYKLGVMLRSMNPALFNNLYLKGFEGNNGDPLIEKKTNTANSTSKTTGYFQSQSGDAKNYWNAYAFMPSNEDGTKRTSWDWEDSTRYNPTLSGNVSVSSHIYTYNGDCSLNQLFLSDTAGIDKSSQYTTDFFKWLTSEGRNAEKGTPAQVLEYMLKAKRTGVAEDGFKAEINILEIQPCNTFSLNERRFYFMIPEFTGTVTVEKQTSSEFLGKTEDLNSLYDMIYIGTNSSTLNYLIHKDGSFSFNKDGKTQVYRHTGTKASNTNGDYKKLRGNFGDSDKIDVYYYSGNDITKIREEELIEFANAGYPVVFGGSFFSDANTINTSLIDTASNIYSFAKRIMNGSEYTLYREGKMEADGTSEKFKDALTMKHCTLVLNPNTPVRYVDRTYTVNGTQPYAGYSDAQIYINGSNINNLQLEFEFYIDDNDAADEQIYGAILYIDENADGRYVEDEQQNVLVKNVSTGRQIKNSNLEANTNYKLTCTMDKYVGVLPWKLEIYRKDNQKIRDMETGMSAIKIYEDANGDGAVNDNDRTTIKVLQITSNNNTVSLPTDAERARFESSGDDGSVTYAFHKYTKALEEFDVHFTRLSVSEFEAKAEADSKYLEKGDDGDNKGYDMIILGFADCYTDIDSTAALEAIEDAIERGVSVLFTHDTTSFVNLSEGVYGYSDFWGYHINKYFREMVGMDRYGVTLQYPIDSSGETPISLEACYNLGKDVPYKTGASQQLVDADGNNVFDDVYTADAGAVSSVTSSVPTNKLCSHSQGYWSQTETTHTYYCSYTSRGRRCSYNNTSTGTHTETSMITKTPTTTSTGVRTYYCPTCSYVIRTETIAKLSSTEYYMTQGYSNGALYRYTAGGGSNVEVNTVTQTNSGQITEYPYKIDETFTCATTHAQYYQLDMEADDIVVWYCLGGSNYANNPNDARNNYYIYNRGNITYSGVGHRGGLTDTEVKLFVNTMVAAYNASATQPKITLTNADKVAMGDVDALYINYDYAGAVGMDLNDFIQRNVDISYKMIENNILSNKKVKVKYYLLQGKKWDATTKSFTDEVVFASEDELLANTYYKTYTKPSGDVIRIDPHVLLSTTTKEVEDGTTMSVSDGAASIKSNTEYYFNYEVLKEKPDGSMDLESLFEDSHYIPLEIEITMTYGKRQDKEIVVRKPIILYRRALFDLD